MPNNFGIDQFTLGQISSPSFLVKGADRLRVKMWNSVGSGANFQAKLVVKFVRAGDPFGIVQTVTKILTPSNDRGVAATNAASFPFGTTGGWGRTVTDANTTAASGTITSATAAFTAGDIGKQVTISGAATMSVATPQAGPEFPTTLYQGVITAVGGATTATVSPNCQVTQGSSNATLKIEPPLLSDSDGAALGDGWIIGIDINFWQSSSKRGQAFFEAEVNRIVFNGHEGILLIRDYLESSNHISWPFGRSYDRGEGPGNTTSITVADPAAGAEIIATVPNNTKWRIQSFRFALVTNATAGNRFVSIRIKDVSGNILYDLCAQLAHVASTTIIYTAAPIGPHSTPAAVINNRQQIPLPSNLIIGAGFTVETSTAGLLAGDDFTVPFLLVEEWIA